MNRHESPRPGKRGQVLRAEGSWILSAPPCLQAVLERSGWYPGRSIGVSSWTQEIVSDGFVVSDFAPGIWRSLGGLELASGRTASLLIDPADVQDYGDAPFVAFPARFGQQFCPIGSVEVLNLFVGSEAAIVAECGPGPGRKEADAPADALHALLFPEGDRGCRNA